MTKGKPLYSYSFGLDDFGNRLTKMSVITNKRHEWVHISDKLSNAILEAAAPYPIPEGKTYEYGTAGFRMKANAGLDHVMFTSGLMACIRSKNRERTIGIMITASHNPAEDNGVKLVDPMGDMLHQEWEAYATTFANTDTDGLPKAYEELLNEELREEYRKLDSVTAKVIFGRDTRASGPALVKALTAALDALSVDYTDVGVVTTPQLHYLVRATNMHGSLYDFGVPTIEGYYEKLAKAFKTIMHGRTINGSLTVDCANGVGGPKLIELIKYLPSAADGGIDIKVINADVLRPEALNFECGADFVKTKQRGPAGFTSTPNARYCSLDGDADRLVYYYADDNKTFHLLDGDRIATLAAVFLADMTRVAGLGDKLKIGVVQTAYANGASTEYIEKVLKLPVECTPTGVKHLHSAAHRYDIGVYFEANGHGTILFNQNAIDTIRNSQPKSPGQKHALDSLSACIDLINQAVGDALSDMLFAEVVLAHKSWTMDNWQNTYIDLPNYLKRVEVRDRRIFKTTDQERRLVEPKGIQEEIEKFVGLYPKGRSFVRASGTEDAVRVYAEAHSKVEANKLAVQVEALVKQYAS